MLCFDGPLKLTGGGEGFYQMADTVFRWTGGVLFC